MAAPTLGTAFKIGLDVLKTVRDDLTNQVMLRLGHVRPIGSDIIDSDRVEMWQHAGFVSMPPEPTDGGVACQAFVVSRSGHDVCIATRDARGLELAGLLKPGETCMYAGGPEGKGQARALCKADGSVTLYTKHDNTKDGIDVFFRLSPTALEFSAPWGSFTFDASGFHLKTLAGPRIDMGGLSLPGLGNAPLVSNIVTAMSGYFKVTAPTIKLVGSGIFLGGVSGAGAAPASYSPASYAPYNQATDPPPSSATPKTTTYQSQTVWMVP